MPFTTSQRGATGFQPFTRCLPHSAAPGQHLSPFAHSKLQWRGARPASRSFSATNAAGGATAGLCSWAAASSSPRHSGTYLADLHVKDFALVTEQHVELEPGLTVVTGESGSGKSVLVEALGQLLGAAAFDEAVRPPSDTAVLQGVVVVAPPQQAPLQRLLQELGVPQRASRDLGRLVLRRELVKGPDGSVRSRAFINGSPTSVRVLREVGSLLVDVNGQHAALSLKDAGAQLRLLDRLAGTVAEAQALDEALAAWQRAHAQLRELAALADEEVREGMQRMVDEVQAAGVEPGEDSALRRALRQLDGRRAAAERCHLVSVGLGGDGGGGGGIAEALRDVQLQVKQLLSQEERLAAAAAAEREQEGGDSIAPGEADAEEREGGEAAAALLQSAVGLLGQAQELLDGAEGQVLEYAKLYRFSQRQYDELSQRLQRLERLLKAHDARSCDELLQRAAAAGAALDAYFALEGQRGRLEQEAAALLGDVRRRAVQLSERRRGAAGRLRGAVESLLAELAMGGSRFDVRVRWTPALAAGMPDAGSRQPATSGTLAVDAAEAAACCEEAGVYRLRAGGAGLDAAQFLFAGGPSEPLRPLAAVASGGESARVMLALKAAPALLLDAAAGDDGAGGAAADGDGDSGSTCSTSGSGGADAGQVLVLDEVDSGVGSRLGQPIGRILRRMAAAQGPAAAQILCVSHLPQVAAHADTHLVVRKALDPDSRMVTRFQRLSRRDERLAEISAMLGLPHAAAEELLQQAAQPSAPSREASLPR